VQRARGPRWWSVATRHRTCGSRSWTATALKWYEGPHIYLLWFRNLASVRVTKFCLSVRVLHPQHAAFLKPNSVVWHKLCDQDLVAFEVRSGKARLLVAATTMESAFKIWSLGQLFPDLVNTNQSCIRYQDLACPKVRNPYVYEFLFMECANHHSVSCGVLCSPLYASGCYSGGFGDL
jgi:hypothetical protein